MQKDNTSFENNFYTTTTTASENAASIASAVDDGADEKSFFFDNFSRNPFLSSKNHASAASFYSSLISQPSTTPSESSFEDSEAIATERRLHQASYILQYQQLYKRYTLCLAHLQESIKELDALRLENADLAQRLRVLSQSTIQNCLAIASKSSSAVRDSYVAACSESPPIDHNLLGHHNHEQFPFPKSISVRSSRYPNLKPSKGDNPSHNSSRIESITHLPDLKELCVPREKREEEVEEEEAAALELEAYNQGMLKTELCNKWEETGACPYGDNCRYAHGINELRPVIRHPRYKTQVCRMVLAGDTCPYGHRCHFRHSLTHQERLIASQAQL